jgi:hypothetical protein
LALKKRLSLHKSHYKRWLNKRGSYCSSFEIIKSKDACIELLEELECKCTNIFRQKEGEWQKKLNCINKNVAGRTHKQYVKDRQKYLKKRIYCECGSYYQRVHKSDHFKSKRHIAYIDEKIWKVDPKRFNDPRAVFSNLEPVKSLDSDQEN